MSLHNINSFCLTSIKSEIEHKERVTIKNKSKYSNQNCKKLIKKVNPKLKLPPLEKSLYDLSETKSNDKLKLADQFLELKSELRDLKKLFNSEPNSELQSNCEEGSQIYLNESEVSLDEKQFEQEDYSQINLDESEISFDVKEDDRVDLESQPSILIEDTKSEISETTILPIVESIIELEEKLKDKFLELEETKQDRVNTEEEICKEVQTFCKCPFEKRNSQKFLKICNFKRTKQSISKTKFVANPIKIIKPEHHKSQEKFTKSKNTQLSKNSNMSTLTDEEKARIKELLSDMDENGEDIVKENLDNGDQEPQSYVKNDNFSNNRAFVFADGDRNKIDEIKNKLSIFEETKERRENPESSDRSYDQIDWKEINNLTVKEIDKALERIHLKEKVEKIGQITLPQSTPPNETEEQEKQPEEKEKVDEEEKTNI